MSLDNLLNRLDKIRKTGSSSWVACCPAHDDKNPSLSIKEIDDGRILIHCFAGCDTQSILRSIDMSMSDLFPKPLGDLKRLKKPFNASEILVAIGYEASIVANSASKVLNEGGLNFVEKERLSLAVSRIHSAINLCGIES